MMLADGDPKEKRNVVLMKDSILEYPDLYMSIYVETRSPYEQAQFAELFVRSRCTKAESPDDADLVIFTGGTDVDPRLYGAKPMGLSDSPDVERDNREIALYLYCVENGIPMCGICRGMQFLWVMNAGELYQDVNNHNGAHPILDVKEKTWVEQASSLHHQMCKPSSKTGAEILATSHKATHRWIEQGVSDNGTKPDIEAYWIRESCCLGVQGHPEYRNYAHFSRWFLNLVAEYIMYNPDLDGSSGKYRIKPDVLQSRGFGRPETLASTAQVEVENPGPQQEA